MPTYMFLCSTDSRETVKFDIKDPPLQFSIPLDNDTLTMKLWLFGAPSFTVEIVSNHDIVDVGRLADIISHTLAGLYDSVGLSMGRPLAVRLEGFSIVGSKTFGKFAVGNPAFLEAIQTAGLSTHDWVTLCVSSPHLRAGLRDIRLGMQTPGEAAVHCFRAIERIRQSFSSAAGDRKRTWGRLQDSLNINRSWLDTYTAHATAVRHGELVELGPEERNKCFAQAATVIIRFAVYVKGGRQPLSTTTFPPLT
jgi:hypothetical protein